MAHQESDETQRREGALAVTPVRLRDPGGGRRSALAAGLGLVAVLVLAIGLASLPGSTPAPASAQPSPPGVSSGSPSAAPASEPPLPTGDPSAAPASGPAVSPAVDPVGVAQLLALTPAQDPFRLAREIRNVELDGRVILVHGRLEVIRFRCPVRGTCVMAAIQGMDVRVTVDDWALPWREIPRGPAWLAFFVRHDQLVFLGTAGDPLSTLQLADGWLAVASYCHPGYGADPDCPDTGPVLHPGPEDLSWRGAADGGEQVRLRPDGVVGAPRDTAWFTGPFLLLAPLPPCARMPALGPEDAPGGGTTIAFTLAAAAMPAPSDPPCDTDQRRTVMARAVPGSIAWTAIPEPGTSPRP